ncbi:CIMIP2 protein GA14893 [Drosophila tropicalis]|uniref:CIMIP2 protein GA14893 n=1 Tax=Drosophila tropicalis TaxID=46794 RepID=UPI0035ABAC87
MDNIITPQPHLIPGYTGHCTENRDRVGRTYGKQTHKLLIDPCIYHAPELIVPPINVKQGVNKDFPTKNELKILHEREQLVDAVYKHPIIPGYAGFVPNMAKQMGKRYVAAASAGVAQHETLMELYRCERRTLRHRDLLESGKGLFEHKLNERLLPQTNYRAPLIPVTGRSKGMPQESCPPTTEKLRYSKFTTPHFLEDDDEDKFIINSYAAHIPMTATRFGESNKVLTRRALCSFSDFMYKRKRDQWCCGQDLSGPTVNCPPVGHFLIYHNDSGMSPGYAGHVPGAMYKYGRTYGRTTFDAKRWLCLHKELDVLPEVAHLDYEY